MSREEWREILFGVGAALVFAAVLAVAYVGLPLAARGSSSAYSVFATFNRIDGLRMGDAVQVAGIPVGKVEGMALQPDNRVRVELGIDRSVRLPADTSAAIHTDGLFGGKFMVIEPGGDERLLEDGGAIAYTQDSVVVSELLDLIIAEGRAQRTREGQEGR